ncbi:MAG: hypothetical protein PHU03_06435 [Syntrophales bacterium]|nr:hypothetical protein [Syntrophales bacterium]
MPNRLLIIICAILIIATLAHAEPIIIGKVVGVSDGDTVTPEEGNGLKGIPGSIAGQVSTVLSVCWTQEWREGRAT